MATTSLLGAASLAPKAAPAAHPPEEGQRPRVAHAREDGGSDEERRVERNGAHEDLPADPNALKRPV